MASKISAQLGKNVGAAVRGVISSSRFKEVFPNFRFQEGGKAEWDLMWSRYGEEIDANELSTMRFALSCSKEYQTLQKYLEIAISDEIRVQDKHYVFNYVSKSLYGRDVAWKFIQTNWQWFYDM